MTAVRILVVRLGSMGDIIATLPAVARLKHSIPRSHITWIIEPRWRVLLEDNPHVDSVIAFDRRMFAHWRQAWRELRSERFDFAVDFQGLVKSALVAKAAGPRRIFGFSGDYARERHASWFYSDKVPLKSYHAVERNLDLAAAAGATSDLIEFLLPPGAPEGDVPNTDFVLASPFAGWGAKQWPFEHYTALAQHLRGELGLPLVLNTAQPIQVEGALNHVSTLRGLIYATRKAVAVVGIDSGPMHLAAALGRPGVAIYGPTEPARHGPYGDSFVVLRHPEAVISYRRRADPDRSMLAISPEQVVRALTAKLVAAQKQR